MATLGFRTANKRYKRLFWPMIAIYVAVIFGAKWLFDEDTAPLWLRIACAIATTAPIIGCIWAGLRMTYETDEYTRARQMRALAEGGAIIACAVFLVGFLQIFEVIGPVDVFWFGPAYFAAFGLASCRTIFGKTV
ncbi:hypothetical protein [Hyphomonas johnsonii]|uniref:Transmembrane protein n=1 Tax=Hyphomonas johnsonii MHS-2 TaxID=1280950 RepID=A0A059FML5_9PROT|nr:hypothetical protein [Hyphomonas johnsonii]KCZ91847.1 hypothetical protein HJO_12037 [Hyphomonas johnsonii MHS-2]